MRHWHYRRMPHRRPTRRCRSSRAGSCRRRSWTGLGGLPLDSGHTGTQLQHTRNKRRDGEEVRQATSHRTSKHEKTQPQSPPPPLGRKHQLQSTTATRNGQPDTSNRRLTHLTHPRWRTTARQHPMACHHPVEAPCPTGRPSLAQAPTCERQGTCRWSRMCRGTTACRCCPSNALQCVHAQTGTRGRLATHHGETKHLRRA